MPSFARASSIWLRETDALAVLPSPFAKKLAREGQLVATPLPRGVPFPDLRMRMLWPLAQDASPASRWLRGVVADVAAEHPVPACGPRDSYDYVASRFRCPDGANPLGGDPRAGQAARLGNVGANSEGHVIDVYRVPCASGPVDVYVDMYGCPEMQQMLGM